MVLSKRGLLHTYPEIISDLFFQKKKHLVTLNVSTSTNPKIREPIFSFFKNRRWCNVQKPKPIELYFEDIKNSTFVISPFGNGLDCFRTWEVLLAGSIPIVQTSILDPLFQDLPVLIVEDLRNITPKFLIESLKTMEGKKFNLDKILARYWLDQINNEKKMVRKLLVF